MRTGRPGQGPRFGAAAPAAMGVTIFSGGVPAWPLARCHRSRKKWWGPVVLDAGDRAAPYLVPRERDMFLWVRENAAGAAGRPSLFSLSCSQRAVRLKVPEGSFDFERVGHDQR